jgi:cytidylate kinase
MTSTTFAQVVTVSATYGTGGSVIAPRLAEVLGIPFLDRMISSDLAPVRSEEGLCEGEQEASPTGRFLSYFARAATVGAMVPPDPMFEDDETIRAKSEALLAAVAGGAPGVVLGRAGAVVLANRPRAFHVRLDAPVDRRLKWVKQFEQLDDDAAKRRQSETDRARTLFVKRLYRVDPADPALYHLLLDPTVLGVDRTVRIISIAAAEFFEANP